MRQLNANIDQFENADAREKLQKMSQLVDNCFEQDNLGAKITACEQISLENRRIKLQANERLRKQIADN
jgi:hypothetical protein